MKKLIISIIGPHAGKSMEEIYETKINQINKFGYCYWLHKSFKAKPINVQKFIDNNDIFCYFLEPCSKNVSLPTKICQNASFVSEDHKTWSPLQKEISPTGNMKTGCYGFVFSKIEVLKEDNYIDLRYLSDAFNNSPLKIVMGGSSVICYENKEIINDIKSYRRKISAVGYFKKPYSVFFK